MTQPPADLPGAASPPVFSGPVFSDGEIEAARKLFVGPCEFVAGAATLDAVPAPHMPEIALAGRSNVGKSSLLNALVGHGRMARVSRHPGRTQQLNFFALGKRLSLVDMPGYGYAAVSKATKAVWSDLMLRYLKGRPTLRRALVLVDARHGLKDLDRALFDILDSSAVVYQVVLTKCDALGAAGLAQRIAGVGGELEGHLGAHPVVLPTSSEKNTGIDILRAELAALATPC